MSPHGIYQNQRMARQSAMERYQRLQAKRALVRRLMRDSAFLTLLAIGTAAVFQLAQPAQARPQTEALAQQAQSLPHVVQPTAERRSQP